VGRADSLIRSAAGATQILGVKGAAATCESLWTEAADPPFTPRESHHISRAFLHTHPSLEHAYAHAPYRCRREDLVTLAHTLGEDASSATANSFKPDTAAEESEHSDDAEQSDGELSLSGCIELHTASDCSGTLPSDLWTFAGALTCCQQ
jgi:hypothetical protein